MTTLAEMIDNIKDDQDLEDEVNPFIEDGDIRQYINSGVRLCESHIHNIFEDYFMTLTDLTLTSGSDIVSLPADIFAQKIRRLFYWHSNKNDRYKVKRLKNLDKLMDVTSTEKLEYFMTNDPTNGVRIILNRDANASEASTPVRCFYLRNARTFATDGTEDAESFDIPEFERVVENYARKRVYLKDSDPRSEEAERELLQDTELMIGTLTRREPDEDDEIVMDGRFYRDFVGSGNNGVW